MTYSRKCIDRDGLVVFTIASVPYDWPATCDDYHSLWDGKQVIVPRVYLGESIPVPVVVSIEDADAAEQYIVNTLKRLNESPVIISDGERTVYRICLRKSPTRAAGLGVRRGSCFLRYLPARSAGIAAFGLSVNQDDTFQLYLYGGVEARVPLLPSQYKDFMEAVKDL